MKKKNMVGKVKGDTMKDKINKEMIKYNLKLIQERKDLKNQIRLLNEELEKQDILIKELKDLNFELSSNNQYILEQKKKYIEKNKKLKKENIELKEKEKKENERKNTKGTKSSTNKR
jgi:hypothetical protein